MRFFSAYAKRRSPDAYRHSDHLMGGLSKHLLFLQMNSPLKIDDLYTQSIRVFSYKMHKDMLPGAMASLIGKVDHGYATRGAKSNFFVSHSTGRSIKSIAPKYWNPLSSSLKDSVSIATFKEKSKRDLLLPYDNFSCHIRNCRSCASSK